MRRQIITWTLTFVFSCFLIVGSVLFCSGCHESKKVLSGDTLPDQVVIGFTLYESVSGNCLYKLTAEEAVVVEKEGLITVRSPEVTFYDDAGNVSSVLTAREGAILTRTEDLVARGGVEVRTADSTVLKTDSLMWINRVREVRTEAPVTIETPRGKVAGEGLVADASLSRIEIISEVRGSSDYEFAP